MFEQEKNSLREQELRMAESSPAEKLGNDDQNTLPGVENPDSTEIKQEKNPNTE